MDFLCANKKIVPIWTSQTNNSRLKKSFFQIFNVVKCFQLNKSSIYSDSLIRFYKDNGFIYRNIPNFHFYVKLNVVLYRYMYKFSLFLPVLYHTSDSLSYISKWSILFLIGILSSNEEESWSEGCIPMCRTLRLKLSKKMSVQSCLKIEMFHFHKLVPTKYIDSDALIMNRSLLHIIMIIKILILQIKRICTLEFREKRKALWTRLR